MIKTRFAPSPTGSIHIGNVRTALYNKLYAVKFGGEFKLRIEDTDRSRSLQELSDKLQQDLCKLGLDWNGEVIYQSQRAGIYRSYLKRLEDMGLVYPCFCSKERLLGLKEEQIAHKKPPRYDEYCKKLPESDRLIRLSSNLPCIWRFDTSKYAEARFTDIVKGELKFDMSNFEDFIICRQEGDFSFIFTNVVDDLIMGITHVIRGEDHLSNTAKQVLLGQALFAEIKYAHVGLITNENNQPLSKRENHSSVDNLLSMGYLPDAIVNYLARLGTNISSNELSSIDELAVFFDINKLSKNNVRFDLSAFNFWQKKALTANTNKFLEAYFSARPEKINLKEKINDMSAFLSIVKENCILFDDIDGVLDLIEFSHKDRKFENGVFIKHCLEATAENKTLSYKDFLNTLKDSSGLSGKELFQPLRDLMVGGSHLGNLADLFDYLGYMEINRRIKYFYDKIYGNN